MPTTRFLAPLLALSLFAPGCASRYTVPSGPPTYAADAKISVKLTKTGNREVTVKMVHLAPLKRIDPGLRGYVVWISVPGQGTTRAGMLNYNERRRIGKLVATTPHPKFEVFVTIERSPTVTQPTGTEIVRKLVSKI